MVKRWVLASLRDAKIVLQDMEDEMRHNAEKFDTQYKTSYGSAERLRGIAAGIKIALAVIDSILQEHAQEHAPVAVEEVARL